MRALTMMAGLCLLMGGAANVAAAEPAGPVTPATAPEIPAPEATQVIAYYFHTTARCATCRKIESWSAEAIRSMFADALADSSLLLMPINTDEPQHEHFLRDFQLYTKSLVVVEMRGGERVRWENLTQVWELINDRDKFFAYVQGSVRAFLTEPQESGS